MPWLVKWLDAVHERFSTGDRASLNAVIVFYQLLLVAYTIDLTRPMQAFDYVRF